MAGFSKIKQPAVAQALQEISERLDALEAKQTKKGAK